MGKVSSSCKAKQGRPQIIVSPKQAWGVRLSQGLGWEQEVHRWPPQSVVFPPPRFRGALRSRGSRGTDHTHILPPRVLRTCNSAGRAGDLGNTMHHAPSFQPRAQLPARRATQAPDRPRGRPELVAQIPPTPGSARGGGVTYPSEERGLGSTGFVLHAGKPRATLPGGRGRAEEEGWA